MCVCVGGGGGGIFFNFQGNFSFYLLGLPLIESTVLEIGKVDISDWKRKRIIRPEGFSLVGWKAVFIIFYSYLLEFT